MDDDGLLDWELLHGSDTESTDSIISEKSSSVIDVGMILLSDHFSADNLVTESGDSSRVDHGSEPPNRVDLGLDQFSVNQLGDDCVRNELGVYDVLGDGEVRLSGFDEAANEKDLESEAAAELTGGTVSHYEVSDERHVESQSGVEEPIEDSSKSWSDAGGNELVSGDSGVVNGEDDEIVSDSVVASTEASEGNGGSIVEVGGVRSGDEGKSREIVWWKMPFVLLKYSVFKIGPVWSVSMAAAVMGLVLLGRRLYNMKKKAQRFHLKVTIDDKKASRVMSQAARLNEVFTEVRRVPVIRPVLPSPGAWPVMSLR
ncbi:PREDICTED: uncharacterized protein LOC104721326 [Camelina sativa]|uniref:Uncharacterized protein LOC104721326 n=1 Tax=Camelina sativa TaxID=90675 RepID=A0ABM0U8P4_CAMSA|nr:PREDICTED: uncharacterized protein LOC104721326 [Camelina sativa]